jgi:DNA-binding transcriptional ArsR family regulator
MNFSSAWYKIANHLMKNFHTIFRLTVEILLYIFNQMVNKSSSKLNLVFGALSDPTRRTILEKLARQEATVTELAEPFKMSLPAISKHLRVLEEAGLLSRRRDGRVHHIHLNAVPLIEAVKWLDHYHHFWEMRLESLGRFLSTQKKI